MTTDLFDDDTRAEPRAEVIAPGALLLRGFARPLATSLLDEVAHIADAAPWRHQVTPGGQRMAVAMTNCGPLGWVSDRRGYRYTATDPSTDSPWPEMPRPFRDLAQRAAATAGFAGFAPDACLVNRYAPGTRLSLHQDRDEHDQRQPIVSVSLGLPAVFLFGGATRAAKPRRIGLRHGDVVVWGGPSRLAFHGVMPVAGGVHEATGECRINITFRRAG